MKKNKLTKMQLTSVDLVNRGANQDAHIKLYKSDTPDNTPDDERHILKKAFDYLKTLFGDGGAETIAKSDIANEYDGYATQLLKSFDSIIDNDTLSTEEKSEMMQKSIQEFSAFMEEAVPVWAVGKSVVKSAELSEMIAKAENPDIKVEEEERKESDNDMDISKYSLEEQEQMFKALKEKFEAKKKDPETPDNWVDEGEGKEGKGVVKSDIKIEDLPEAVQTALKKSDEFIKAQELKEMKDIAKKYEILGVNADELGQQLYDLKKSDSKLYDASIQMFDTQVETINKSGLFTEIGKSGANHGSNDNDVIAKAESLATEIRKSAPNMTQEQAMSKVWDTHPELFAEYMDNL